MIVNQNTKLSRRQEQVYNFVINHNKPISVKRLSLLTGWLQHSISGRFTELIELGYFRECTGDDAFEIIDGYKNRNCVAIPLN